MPGRKISHKCLFPDRLVHSKQRHSLHERAALSIQANNPRRVEVVAFAGDSVLSCLHLNHEVLINFFKQMRQSAF